MKATVLIVEDSLCNIEICQDMFRYNDIPAELVVAQTGEASLQLALDLQPDLILMDLRLPGMDGLEVTETLRGDPRTAHIPVWAITAYAMPQDEKKARAAGCCEYFVKPLHPRLLSDRIRAFLDSLPEPVMPPWVGQPS
jgi:two-component system, cell cycle response regulator DivK